MIAKKKILILPILVAITISVFAFLPQISYARAINTKGTGAVARVVGMAKFVLKGTVISVSGDNLALHVTNTTKNAKLFDNKDKTLTIGNKTKITKKGKNISLKQVKSGDKVKIFGIFDKTGEEVTLVRWIKIMAK